MRGRDPLANPAPLIRRVYSYVAYRIGDGPDAQDVTSETMERALRGRDSYDRAKGTPRGVVDRDRAPLHRRRDGCAAAHGGRRYPTWRAERTSRTSRSSG